LSYEDMILGSPSEILTHNEQGHFTVSESFHG
jgi:hypothetical protein